MEADKQSDVNGPNAVKSLAAKLSKKLSSKNKDGKKKPVIFINDLHILSNEG